MSTNFITKIADVDDAIAFASIAHGGQTDLKGRPYIFHPVRVAEAAYYRKVSDAGIVAAALHDTVEDTDATIELIEHLAGKEVADMVDLLTHRQGQTYEQYIFRMIGGGNREVIEIKCCDIIDNLRPERRTHDDAEVRRRAKYKLAVEHLEAAL